MKKTSLTKGALFQTTGKFLLEGVAFLTAPIFTRILSPIDYGKISIYGTWCSLLTLFVGLQVGASIANAKIEFSEENLPKYMSSVMMIALISFVLFLTFFVLFCYPLAHFINIRVDLAFMLIIQSFASFCINFYNAKLIQLKRADKSMYLMTAVSLLSTAFSLIFVFAFQGERYIYKIYGAGIPVVVIGFFLCFYVLAKGKTFFYAEYWKFCLPITLPLILHGTGHLILGQSDRIMLQKMIGESETGIYSISSTVANVMTTIYMSFNTVWVPYYYEYKDKNNIDEILLRSKRYMMNISFLYTGFLLVVPEVFSLLVPKSYWQTGVRVIPILTLSSLFNYLYLFPVNHEFFKKDTRMIAIGTIFSAILNIALNYVFIKRFSSLGAAMSTCISSVLLFIFHHVIASRIVKDYEYPLGFYLNGLFVVVLSFCLYFLLADLWIIRWVLASCVGIVLAYRIFIRRSLF